MLVLRPNHRAVLLTAIAAAQLPVMATAIENPPALEFGGAYTCKEPQMPVSALRNGVSGDSRITFAVGPDGSISSAAVSGTAPETPAPQRPDLAAADYARSRRYTGPAPKPAPGTYSVVVTWGFA